MDRKDTQQDPAQTASWVHDLLRGVPGEPVPEDVRVRVLDALRAEQDRREASEFNPDADVEDLVELDERTDLGSFGPNAPARYTRDGLGITRC